MGRRDAVQVTLEVIARMRQLEPRLVVSYEPGWETRGNGTSANYEGALVHHTAGASSLAKPFPTQKTLRDGRPDLSGPLCNEAGPACTVDQPRIHVMSANPANHAGASGGRSMGPLPVTSLFNPRVRGLEIDYAGTVPMLAGQLYVAHLWARANADVVGGGDINRVRAHFETSVTGKWDIGFANGKSYDMGAFRRDAATVTAKPITPLLGDPDMRLVRTPDMSIYFVTDIEVRAVSNLALAGAASKAWGAFTEILWPELDALSADADARRARYADATWSHVRKNGEPHPYDRLSGVDGKTARIEEALSAGIPAAGGTSAAAVPVTQEQLVGAFSDPKVAKALAEALADVNDRRARDSDPATGPVS